MEHPVSSKEQGLGSSNVFQRSSQNIYFTVESLSRLLKALINILHLNKSCATEMVSSGILESIACQLRTLSRAASDNNVEGGLFSDFDNYSTALEIVSVLIIGNDKNSEVSTQCF